MPNVFLGDGWPEGVQGSTDSTLLPPTASPRGLNSTLANAPGGRPLAAKRQGLALINATPITSSSPIIGQKHYYNIVTGTHYHMLLSKAGHLFTRALADDTITSKSTAFTSGDYFPDFEVAANQCFIVNGQDRLKFDGTTVTNFGITRPTVGSMAGAAGAAGLHNGTYELRVTYYNSATGHESSASDTASATVTVTDQAIDWTNIPTSSDTQVTHRYLYARNTGTQAQFYRVGTVADNVTTTASTSILDENALTPAPSTTARSRPPSGAKYLAFHQGRLFVATDTALYWSEIDEPEAFNDLSIDGINDSDGQLITGLVSTKEILLIFKQDRVYALFNGNNPVTWQIRLIDNDFGCMSHRSIATIDGVTYWWSRNGLCGWDGGDQITNYMDRYYGAPVVFNPAQFSRISAAKDDTANQLLVAVPSEGSSTADLIIPFNTALQRFEATYWDPMDAASLGESYDSSGVAHMYLGGYAGQLFTLNSGHIDGVPSGTYRGTFVATSGSQTVFEDLLDTDGATAACLTTGGALAERKLQIFTTDGQPVGLRRSIVSNTADTITVGTAITDLTIGTTYEWVVGNPNFEWDTPWLGYSTYKHRYEFLTVISKVAGYGNAAYIDLTFDWADAITADPKLKSFTTATPEGTWDNSLWDVAVWGSGEAVRDRRRVGRVGFVWRARIRQPYPNEPYGLVSLDMNWADQTKKR